jgi:hypothetical protein
MKSYLAVTGSFFTLVALAHAARAVEEWPRHYWRHAWWWASNPALALVSATVAVWAWRLLLARRSR